MKDLLSKEEILKYSTGSLTCDRLHIFDKIDSTNIYCKKLIQTSPKHQTLVIAETQTAGKGRMGRNFFSPADTGIYMSYIIDRKKIILPPTLLTVAAGVSVCRVLRNLCKINANIKWVNDIFTNGKKVCGILAESIPAPKTNELQYIIVGIGINISTPMHIFPEELKDIAGSVFPHNITRNQIIAEIINELNNICSENNITKLINEYKTYSFVIGEKISFMQNGISQTGIATDINCEGNLIVLLENANLIILNSGEVSLESKNFTKTV